MLNVEKHIDEVVSLIQSAEHCEKILALTKTQCQHITCEECTGILKEWLLSEYKKAKTDWSKIPIDTKIIVWDDPEYKYKRYFAGIEDNEIITYFDGRTSWTSEDELEYWDFAELVESRGGRNK